MQVRTWRALLDTVPACMRLESKLMDVRILLPPEPNGYGAVPRNMQ